MKRRLILGLIFIHLAIIFLVNVDSTFNGYYGFYYNNTEKPDNTIHNCVKQIKNSIPVQVYTSYTGFETGYGFFAPNVASDFIFVFSVRDSIGKIIDKRFLPTLKNKEAITRFTTAFSLFLEKFNKNTSDQYKDYLKIIAKRIALDVKSEYPRAAYVNTEIFLHHYPYISNYLKGETEKLILIDRYEF